MATKGLQNVALTYNSNALAAHLDQSSLEMVVNAIGTTTFASSAEETTPGSTKYSVPIGGPWSKALDDILGADATNPPSTLRSFVYQIGPVSNRVTYSWTGSATVGAFVTDYKILSDDPMGVIKWSGTLNISGAPTSRT